MCDDDQPDWESFSNTELAELALSSDLWLNAPALSVLGDRSPPEAHSVALEALGRDDDLLAATALSVLAESDLPSALEYMRRTVSDAPLNILDSMVIILAVDHPVEANTVADLLPRLVSRLVPPAGPREYNLADLLFRQYPQLRDRPN